MLTAALLACIAAQGEWTAGEGQGPPVFVAGEATGMMVIRQIHSQTRSANVAGVIPDDDHVDGTHAIGSQQFLAEWRPVEILGLGAFYSISYGFGRDAPFVMFYGARAQLRLPLRDGMTLGLGAMAGRASDLQFDAAGWAYGPTALLELRLGSVRISGQPKAICLLVAADGARTSFTIEDMNVTAAGESYLATRTRTSWAAAVTAGLAMGLW